MNEKRKKHGSSENESERKTAGREKGRACGIVLNTSICPVPRPPRVNMSNVKICKGGFARVRAIKCFPRLSSRFHIQAIFQDRPALKELYDMSPDVLERRFQEFLCLQQNSLYRAARFANSEGILGFQITIQFAAKTKLRITLDCSNM